LNFRRQRLQIGRPEMSALAARDGHYGHASHHKCAAVVLTLGTLDGKGRVGVGHLGWSRILLRKRIVIQNDKTSNDEWHRDCSTDP
jgi:hypothetical protein